MAISKSSLPFIYVSLKTALRPILLCCTLYYGRPACRALPMRQMLAEPDIATTSNQARLPQVVLISDTGHLESFSSRSGGSTHGTAAQARRPFGQLPSFGGDTPTHAAPKTARSSTLSMFFRGGILTPAVASVLFGLLCFLGMDLKSRGATPVQQAVVSVNATEHAYTPSAAADVSAPLLEGSGFPADAAVPVAIISNDPAEVSKDGGAWNVSAGVGVVSADEKGCPPCDSLFGMLRTSRFHKRVQAVNMQIRGEPKSGTSFMFEWAVNALMVTCSQLGQWYGSRACSVKWARNRDRGSSFREITDRVSVIDMKVAKLVFETPKHEKRGGMAAPCQCQNVDKVTVSISHLYKHNLPVALDCPIQHVDGVAPESPGCGTFGGRPVQNHEDVAACVRASPCPIKDKRLQMLILRDPRAVVVSSFYYLKTHKVSTARLKTRTESVDHYAVRMLPTICRLVHIRYLLLLERMTDKTVEFMYEESLADPLEWHRRWLSSIGLNLPDGVVRRATDTALSGDFKFAAKGKDSHPGGVKIEPSRSYETEVGPETLAKLDDICRLWLPPVLLEKFGVPPP